MILCSSHVPIKVLRGTTVSGQSRPELALGSMRSVTQEQRYLALTPKCTLEWPCHKWKVLPQLLTLVLLIQLAFAMP